jgi:hypothetical protein
MNHDTRLINVVKALRDRQKEYDDIVWDHGVHDPRLSALANEIERLKKLDEDGVVLDPLF